MTFLVFNNVNKNRFFSSTSKISFNLYEKQKNKQYTTSCITINWGKINELKLQIIIVYND